MKTRGMGRINSTRAIPLLSLKDRARFAQKLAPEANTGCLLYAGGHKTKRGYGMFSVKGKYFYAHRVAWAIAGNIFTPDKPLILHNCPAGDNPSCCNAEHLFAGTHQDNMTDVARKMRSRRKDSPLPWGVQRKRNRFRVRYTREGTEYYVGTYKTVQEAAAVADGLHQKLLSDLRAQGAEIG